MPKKIIPSEIQAVTDAVMKEIDVIVVIDKSGSMGDPSQRFQGKTKWEELREDVTAIAREFGKYDADGLTVIPFSSAALSQDGVTADAVAKLFSEYSPRGSTNLAEALQVAAGKVRQSQKQCVVLVFTDGSPDDAKAAVQQIESAGKEFGRPKIGFCFIQVGNDTGATQFLDQLDNDLQVDVVATVSAKDAESLSAQQFAWLAQNA